MIKLKNLKLSFHNQNIFNNLSLHIKKNEKYLLNMPSGTGKTLLLKSIMGYIPIDDGSITVDNKILNINNINEIRSKISFVGQNIVLTSGTVIDYIDYIFSFKSNRSITLSHSKLISLLKEFNLDETILKKETFKLSGGEKQRLLFIITLLLDREIFFFDEITSAMDANLKIKVINRLKNLNKTIIVSSHDLQWRENSQFQTLEW